MRADSSIASRIAMSVLCVLVTAGAIQAADAEVPVSEQTAALMKERVKALEQLVALTKAQYQQGQGTIDACLAAENELLEAEMDLAADRKARIALRRTLVESLKRMEALAKARMGAGTSPRSDHLRVRASRLKAEIGLARELESGKVPE